jgi:hypothetical protein
MDGEKAGQGTRVTEKAERRLAERQKRLAEALRSNLHRRKAQVRARSDDQPSPGESAEGES